jgi:hypothetical protein
LYHLYPEILIASIEQLVQADPKLNKDEFYRDYTFEMIMNVLENDMIKPNIDKSICFRHKEVEELKKQDGESIIKTVFTNFQDPRAQFTICLKKGIMIGKDEKGDDVKIKVFESKGSLMKSWEEIYKKIIKKEKNTSIFAKIVNYFLKTEKRDDQTISWIKAIKHRFNDNPTNHSKKGIAENFRALLQILDTKLTPFFDKEEYCSEENIKLIPKSTSFLIAKSDTFLQRIWWNDWHTKNTVFAICRSLGKFVYKDGHNKIVWMRVMEKKVKGRRFK